jgi:hypothetical protein
VVAVPSIPGYQRDTGAGTVLLSEMAIGWIRDPLKALGKTSLMSDALSTKNERANLHQLPSRR